MKSKIQKILGLITIAVVFSSGLTSCSIKELQSLPDEERYLKINKILDDVDYQNVGTIIKEEKDNGGSALAPAHRVIYYSDSGAFEKIKNNLSKLSEKCSTKGTVTVNCSYGGVDISLGVYEKDQIRSSIRITDSAGGR